MKFNFAKFFLAALAVTTFASCGVQSPLSSDKSNVESVVKVLAEKSGLSLKYEPKLPGIAGGNIEGGGVSINSNKDSYFEIFRYATKEQAKAANKLETSCPIEIKGYFFATFCNDDINIKKIKETFGKL